jgi:hypothetical protein
MEYLILLATIMAIAGVVGYRVGVKAALAATVVIVGGLLLLAQTGAALTQAVNTLYYTVRFIGSGGLAAAGTSSDPSVAATQAAKSLANVRPLVPSESVGPQIVTVLIVLIAGYLVIRTAKALRGKPSRFGMILGLCNGYLAGSYLLNQAVPGVGAPLPTLLQGGTSIAHAGGLVRTLPAPSASVGAQLVAFASHADQSTLGWIIMAAIAIFVVGVLRLGSRSPKAR